MLDDNETEATQDDSTLFSEAQLGGDTDESSSTQTALDADFRVTRLRRPTIVDPKIPSNLPISLNSDINIEKVIKKNYFS